MDRAVLGFLVTLANINNYGNSGGSLKDLTIKVSEVQNLYHDLQAAGVDLTPFKSSGYHRDESVGTYMSENLRDYMFKGEGSPHEEGVILKLYFDENNELSILKKGNDNLSIFLRKDYADDIQDQVQSYLDKRYGYSE